MTFCRFPELATQQTSRAPTATLDITTRQSSQPIRWLRDRLDVGDMIRDFRDFRKLPVFYSLWYSNLVAYKTHIKDFVASLSIASIYLTVRVIYLSCSFVRTNDLQVLSFDGTMLTFLKDSRNYSDPFIAGQRAACTVAGLTGTILFPFISRKLGLVRTGSWSIW